MTKAFLPLPGQCVCGVSKAAVKLFIEGLRSELLETAVRVTSVFPGAIGTNLTYNSVVGATLSVSGAGQSKAKILSAYIAVAIIVEAMECTVNRVLIVSDAKFMEVFYRFHPKFAPEFIKK